MFDLRPIQYRLAKDGLPTRCDGTESDHYEALANFFEQKPGHYKSRYLCLDGSMFIKAYGDRTFQMRSSTFMTKRLAYLFIALTLAKHPAQT